MQKENRINTLNSQSSDKKLNCKFITEQQQSQIGQQKQVLKFRIECLQSQLKTARDRQNRLRVTNTQLSNMILSSNQNSSNKVQQHIQKIEDIILGKLKLTYKNNLIDQKINQINKDTDIALGFDRKSERQAKHSRAMSNFSTMSSNGNQISRQLHQNQQNNASVLQRLSKKDIKDRIMGVKRIQKQLYNF